MDMIGDLGRLVQVEILKYWRKPVARFAAILLLACPIAGDILLASISSRDAVFPRITYYLFASDMLMFIALMPVVISVIALGNDYDLGTVRSILSLGVPRHRFILAKIITTVSAVLINSATYVIGGLGAGLVSHTMLSDTPFFEAAGHDIFWRALGVTLVIAVVGYVSAGAVMLALVLGRTSWAGMLGGLGYFLGDFMLGGIGVANVRWLEGVHRYTFSYYALSLLDRIFVSDPNLTLPRAWGEQGPAHPIWALTALLLLGSTLVLVAILIFRRQDVLAKQ